MSKLEKDHLMRIYKEFFVMLKGGLKTIEVRVEYPSMRKIEVGDVIRFNNDPSCRMLVVRIAKYKNFDDMFKEEDNKKIHPYKNVNEQLIEIRKIFPPNKERLGVIIFEMKKT